MEDYKKKLKEARLEAGKLMTQKQLGACNGIIHTAAAASGAAGVIPIPVADAIPITAAQVTMVVSLGKTFGVTITESAAKSIIAAAAATFVGRTVVKLIPVAGWIASGVVAAGVTEAIGWIAAVDFAKQYRSEYEKQKSEEESAKNIKDLKDMVDDLAQKVNDMEEDSYSSAIDPGKILNPNLNSEFVEEEFVGKVCSNNSNLSLREKPDVSSRILTTLPHGTALKVRTTQDPKWYAAEYQGVNGYVVAKLIVVDQTL